MKPVKSLIPLSKWMMRVALLTWIVLQYGSILLALAYKTQLFYVAVAFLLFGVLLFAGGFVKKPSLTVISALLLSLLFVFVIYSGFVPKVTSTQIVHLMFLSVCLNFLATGNK